MQHKSDKCQEKSRITPANVSGSVIKGYDPELLYVECSRCGAPVLWEPGKATALLEQAGVDPIELDSSCLLLTDACPACGSGNEFTVRIFRVSKSGADAFQTPHGHA